MLSSLEQNADLGEQGFWCQENWIIWNGLTSPSTVSILMGCSLVPCRLCSLWLMHKEDLARVPGSPGTCPLPCAAFLSRKQPGLPGMRPEDLLACRTLQRSLSTASLASLPVSSRTILGTGKALGVLGKNAELELKTPWV